MKVFCLLPPDHIKIIRPNYWLILLMMHGLDATSAPFQHFSMAVFRAVETRLYLVRAANTGISGIIDPTGRIIAKTNIFQEDALKGYVKFVKIPTFYDKHGDILVIICFVLMTFYFLITFVWRKKCQ